MRVGTQNWLIPKSGHWMVFFTCQYILLQAPSHAWNHFPDILWMALWRSLQQRQFPRPLSEQSQRALGHLQSSWCFPGGAGLVSRSWSNPALSGRLIKSDSWGSEKQNEMILNAAWDLRKELWKWSTSQRVAQSSAVLSWGLRTLR